VEPCQQQHPALGIQRHQPDQLQRHHGAIFGPWGTSRIIGTQGGTSTGTVVLWPTYPWNNGHNFSVIWQTAS
jgi:hypothetical protein